jgi:hypothetical protein
LPTRPLSTGRKVGLALVPWVPLALIGVLYVVLLLPRVQEGHLAAMCMGGIASLVFAVFLVAAVTFSLDVLRDRWQPGDSEHS